MVSKDDLKALQKAFDKLYTSLNDAYWAASTMEAKDQIHGAKDLVSQVLDQLVHAHLQSNNAAMEGLTESLNSSIKDLKDLQGQVDQIVHSVSVADSALQAIDDALTVAGKVAAAI